MRSKLRLALFTASLLVLPACVISPPQSPCAFGPVAATAANQGGGGGTMSVEPGAIGLPVGPSRGLRVIIRDANGNVINQQATYGSSDPSVASVGADGQVTPLKPGTTNITVTSPAGAISNVRVTVVLPTAGALTVTPTSLTLNKLGPAPTTLSVAGGTGRPPTYSSNNPNVVTVAPDGTVTAIGNGNATVTVVADGVSLQVPITVAVTAAQAAYSLGVVPSAIGLPVGSQVGLKTTVRDGSGAVVNQIPTYVSSDPSVATVDSTGQVNALRLGAATITVSVPGDSRNVPVNVTQAGVMTVSPSALKLNALGVSPVGLTVAGNKAPVTFTSGTPGVVTVGANGAVTAVANGTSVVTVSDGTTTLQVPITVAQEFSRVVVHASADGKTDQDSRDPSDNRNKFAIRTVGDTARVRGLAKDENGNDLKVKGWRVTPLDGTADGEITVDNDGLVKFNRHTPGSPCKVKVTAITEGDRESSDADSLEIDGPNDRSSAPSTGGDQPSKTTTGSASPAPGGASSQPSGDDPTKKGYRTNASNCT